MKRLFPLVILCFSLLSSFITLNSIDDVVGALKTGNATQLAKFFDNSVEVSMPDKSNNYSKSQAEMVLKDFFSINNVKGFEVIHKGQNGGSQYCIGTLQTISGSYRTTIFMKRKGGAQFLQELRFENR